MLCLREISVLRYVLILFQETDFGIEDMELNSKHVEFCLGQLRCFNGS
jgi:hypothetical protein